MLSEKSDMIYFDNAATSYPKPKSVISEVKRAVLKYGGNPGRSGHSLSLSASEAIYDVREAVAEHFSFPYPERVVFTYNATYALNIAIRALIARGSHVLCSDIEHNSVIRPLELMKNEGEIEYSLFSSAGDLNSNIKGLKRNNTKAIISTLCSNVTGKRIPIQLLSEIAKKEGFLLIVDASQAAGHEKIDLSNTPCDCLCAPGHKGLFGILGCGFIIFSREALPRPFIAGGSGTNSKDSEMPKAMPERLEAGSAATPAIAALGAGIGFVNSIGIDEIKAKEIFLTDKLKSGLSAIRNITLYDTDGSIVLFNSKKHSEYIISSELDRYGIAVRGGFHCAPSAHRLIGTENTGAVRLSVSYFNTDSDVDNFLKTLSKIQAEM